MNTKEKDLKYYRNNAEEDYMTTPISVLRYIGELEAELKAQSKFKSNGDLADVSHRTETNKCLDEIFEILDEACKEVDNGIYKPKLEALKTILDTYKISKYGG